MANGLNAESILKALITSRLTGRKTPDEIEMGKLRLEALREGRSPTSAYQANINLIAGDYKTSIDSESIGTDLGKLRDYKKDRLIKDKNILPTTLDYIDNTIKNMEDRSTVISSFNTHIDELANIENSLNDKINIYMNPETSAEIKNNTINEIKKVNEERMRISNSLKAIDGTRYYRDRDLQLADSDIRMKGAFAIDAIHSDGLMDKYEHGIWQNAIDSDNPEIIKNYYTERSTFKKQADDSMLEGFMASAGEVSSSYDAWQYSVSEKDDIDVQQNMKDDFNIKKDYLQNLKSQMTESMGLGKVNHMWNTIFPDGAPWSEVIKKEVIEPQKHSVVIKKKDIVEKVLPKVKEEDKQTYASIDTREDAEGYLVKYLNGEISDKALRRAGGQSLVNNANRIKDAYRGEYAGKKSRTKPIKDIETLKGLTYGHQSYKHSWDDVVGGIFKNKGKFVTDTEASILTDEFLSYGGDIENFLKEKNIDVLWRKNRRKIEGLKKKFKDTNLSLEDYKKEYPSHYKKIKNALALRRV